MTPPRHPPGCVNVTRGQHVTRSPHETNEGPTYHARYLLEGSHLRVVGALVLALAVVASACGESAEAVPLEVAEYWALEGTLESVGGEEGWLCPVRGNLGFTASVEAGEMPRELEVGLPGQEPDMVLNRDNGPSCVQPHLFVMLATSGPESGADYTAGMTVWPQTTRFEDTCGAGCTWVGGTAEELTINAQPARLHIGFDGHTDAWWFDASGTPMYAETYGLPRDRVLGLINAITIEPSMRRATVDAEALGDLDVVSNQTSVGFWKSGLWRSAVYNIDGSEIAVDTSYDAAFDPRARFAPFIWTSALVDVDDIPAVWADNGAGYTFLEFAIDGGVHITISGFLTSHQSVALAEQLG